MVRLPSHTHPCSESDACNVLLRSLWGRVAECVAPCWWQSVICPASRRSRMPVSRTLYGVVESVSRRALLARPYGYE